MTSKILNPHWIRHQAKTLARSYKYNLEDASQGTQKSLSKSIIYFELVLLTFGENYDSLEIIASSLSFSFILVTLNTLREIPALTEAEPYS